jgi:hypothetical protein
VIKQYAESTRDGSAVSGLMISEPAETEQPPVLFVGELHRDANSSAPASGTPTSGPLGGGTARGGGAAFPTLAIGGTAAEGGGGPLKHRPAQFS